MRRRLIAVAAILAGLTIALPAMADTAQPVTVSANPVDDTPHVLDGTVRAIAVVGGTVVVGGEFTRVTDAGRRAVYPRKNLFAYELSTGRVLNFAPPVDGVVNALATGRSHARLPDLLRRYITRSVSAPNGRGPARSRYSRHHTGRVPMTHAGQQDRPYDGQHSRRPPQQPAGGISTGRALGLAIALTLALLAAGTGVLAAAGVLFPVSGQAEGKPAEGKPAALAPPSALAGQPSTPPPAAPTPPPEPLVPPAPSRQAAPGGQLIAFGATAQNWDAHHRLDGAVAGGTAYNPDTALAGNGRLADRYVRVLPLNGRILQYTVQLPRGTSFATASAQALAELPPDVRLIWRQQRGACTQASYTSPTLARELTDVGDPKGAVLIEYRSGITIGAAYDAADVTSATLSALDAPTPASGPLC